MCNSHFMFSAPVGAILTVCLCVHPATVWHCAVIDPYKKGKESAARGGKVQGQNEF